MTDLKQLAEQQSDAVRALLNYEQADFDGIIVKASRQAIHEVVDELAKAAAEKAALEERVKRLEEKNERLRKALRFIGTHQLVHETEKGYIEYADLKDDYECLIIKARAALENSND